MTVKARKGRVLAVVGGQYGSEGKGVIVAHLARKYGVHARVGGPNAGHSFYYKDNLFKMQSIPCGWTNFNAQLIIGRGGLVDMRQVFKEVSEINRFDPGILDRLKIDSFAGVLDERHHAEEGGVSGGLHQRIGSTGEGVGAARIARIQRDPEKFSLAYQVAEKYGLKRCLMDDAASIIRTAIRTGEDVLLEGTQGAGLSLIHGQWPYVTSADTNAGQFAADLGIAPRLIDRTLLVVRTHPIRVAGNSGPLKGEVTWDEMSKRLGRQVQERTTVTKKVRRIGEWDEDLFLDAVRINAPTSLALTFADYLDPKVEGTTVPARLSTKIKQFIDYMETKSGVPVLFVGTGGAQWSVVELAPDMVP